MLRPKEDKVFISRKFVWTYSEKRIPWNDARTAHMAHTTYTHSQFVVVKIQKSRLAPWLCQQMLRSLYIYYMCMYVEWKIFAFSNSVKCCMQTDSQCHHHQKWLFGGWWYDVPNKIWCDKSHSTITSYAHFSCFFLDYSTQSRFNL